MYFKKPVSFVEVVLAIIKRFSSAKRERLTIINKRQRLAQIYNDALQDLDGISLIKQSENIRSPYYKYIVYLDDKYERDKIKTKLKNDFKVSLPGEVYSQLCHSQPVFNKYTELVLNDPKDQFPGAEYVSNQQICLPLYPDLRVDELMYVVDSLRSVLDSLN